MGKHYLLNLYGCEFDILNNEVYLRNLIKLAAETTGATVLQTISHKFDPYGVTALCLLSESHISIHTWPEKGMAVCDVFTCGDTATPEDGVEYMKEQLKATDIVSHEFVRPLE